MAILYDGSVTEIQNVCLYFPNMKIRCIKCGIVRLMHGSYRTLAIFLILLFSFKLKNI